MPKHRVRTPRVSSPRRSSNAQHLEKVLGFFFEVDVVAPPDMNVTVSITRVGPRQNDLIVNIYQDAPEWKAAGTSLRDLGPTEVLKILREMGVCDIDTRGMVEGTATPSRAQRRQLRINAEQEHYIQQTFPPEF